MHKMFKLIEDELKNQDKSKVWLADKLNESTQNINNWKTRGVPASKVKKIAEALNISREYLEGDTKQPQRAVASTKADYPEREQKLPQSIEFVVFVESNDKRIAKLLSGYLHKQDELSFFYCTHWRYDNPFIEIDIWQGKDKTPARVYLLRDRIVGITDYSSDLHKTTDD